MSRYENYHALDTPFGRLWLVPTSATHISANGGHNLNVAQEYPEGTRMGPIEVNRVSYAFHGHLYLWTDGHWHFGLEDNPDSQRHEPYMSKNNLVHPYKSYNDNQPSWAALDKVRKVIPPLVDKWAADNAEVLRSAQAEDMQEKREKLLAEVAEKQKEIDKLLGEISLLSVQIKGNDVAVE